MTLQECYLEMEGNYADVKSRLTKDERIEKYMIRFLDDDSFPKLCEAKDSGNDQEVFRAVHTLKGVCLNLGFQKLYQACHVMTEAVRGGVKLENEALFSDVENAYHLTVDCIKRYCEQR